MRIQDAIKSGRPFKRKGSLLVYRTDVVNLTTADILAEDWVIEEQRITISQSEYFNAFREYLLEESNRRNLVAPYDGYLYDVTTAVVNKLWEHFTNKENI